ncbi:unnamed protein product [Vicia faba]|uniref:Plastid lipid-associated protein/fibrillin conserved domain-containing protein n=1 Tax=Vicia faba TaxID=3906 RepID=A0AAV1AZ68_VICFA|nr:unnamed protein product [Vicia faba]
MGMELLALNSSPLCNVTPRTRRRIHHTPNNYKASVAMMMASASKVSVAMMMTSASKVYDSVLENKKHVLLTSLQDTQRGLLTTPHQRSSIEQALVNVEGTNVGQPIDFNKLDGTWRLQYTSAPDVLVLFQAAATLPFFQVGQIFQKFECRHNSTGGIIRNVVRWSIPNFFELKCSIQIGSNCNLTSNKTYLVLQYFMEPSLVFLPHPYITSVKVQWRVFEKLFTDFRDCFNHLEYYDMLACAKSRFQPIPST